MRSLQMLLYILLITKVAVFAQSEINPDGTELNYPIPIKTDKLLFYIQRSLNRNTIAYELNIDIGNRIITKNPVLPYWIRFEEDGARKELSYIEQKFAYGIKSERVDGISDIYKLELVSYPLAMELKRSNNNMKYDVLIKVNGRQLILRHIYFKTVGDSFWNPKLKYIDITGVDVKTKVEICERIIP